jgi:transcriptional regulator with GAF, ATPase, and Fis domain
MRDDEDQSPLVDAARAVNSSLPSTDVLEVIVSAARRAIPEFDHAGISIAHPDGRVETVAATDDFVLRLDDLQNQAGEGPCLEVLTEGSLVVVENLRHAQRWPAFVPAAARAGLRAQIAARIHSGRHTRGSLNLYSSTSDTIPAAAPELARLLATDAAIVLGHRDREHHLSRAIESHEAVGLAVGITMERYRIDRERAMDFLVRASQASNVKVRVIAEQLIAAAEERYGAE